MVDIVGANTKARTEGRRATTEGLLDASNPRPHFKAMKKLHHFTSWYHLHGIGRFGLTIGDVPTDIDRWEGRCGVWLTSDAPARGHGLEGGSVDKSRYRLTVEVSEDDPALVKWTEWAGKNATPATVQCCTRPRLALIRLALIPGTSISGSSIRRKSRSASTWTPASPSRVGVIRQKGVNRCHQSGGICGTRS
jgi:hypothetical protein